MNNLHIDEKPVEILLVEDNPKDIELTLYALQKNNIGNHIEVVRDGEEALDFIYCRANYSKRSPNNTPKVILLDLKLPKVDGLEVLKIIKADKHLAHIPVVVLTSSREDRDLVQSYELGVNSYMVKPIDFNQFTDAVRDLGLYWVLHNVVPQQGVNKASVA